MKRTIILIGTLAASALLFSCSKNSTTPAPAAVSEETERTLQDLDPDVYLLSFGGNFEKQAPAQEEADTKVVVTPDSGDQSFEDGDEVLVYVPAVSAKGLYVYDATEAQFSPKTVDDAVAVGDNYAYAYYPAGEFSVEGGKVSFTMPAAVTELPGKKTPLGGILPAGASDATFKNLGSILRFSFSATRDNGETLTAVELSGEGVNITGKGSVTWSENTADGIPQLSELDGDNSLTLTLAAPLRLTTAPADVFFFLPPGGELANLTVKAIYGKDGGYAPFEGFRRANAMTLGRGNIVKVEIALSGFFGGGDGSAEHPYVIASADDFKAIATLANATSAVGGNGYDADAGRTFFGSEGVHYRQAADIDFENADISANMIGGAKLPFAGTYDGDNKALSNFTISGTPNGNEGVAPFKAVNGAVLKKISISGASVTGGKFTAGLVGYATGAGLTIQNCSIEGSTIADTGHDYGVGGLIGGLYGGTVTGCSGTDLTISTTASGKRYFGGLISYINGIVTVSGCELNGITTITNAYLSGGIVGQINNANVTVTNCHNHSNITASSSNYIGGILGYATVGTVSHCSNDGEINGANSVAGIIGQFNGKEANVTDCVNTGDITASSNYAGGVVAHIKGGNISNCRSDATVIATGSAAGGLIGGIEGNLGIKVQSCFAKGNVKGTNQVGGFVGNMQADAAYIVNSLAAANVVVTGNDGNQGAGGFVGYLKNATNGKNAWIGNCAVYDVIVKAPNQTSNTNPVRIGGFAGVHNFATTRSNSMIQNCYYQGVAQNLGYGGGDDFTTKPTTIDGGYHGGIAGYSAGYLLDCYSTPKVKANGSGGTYTNNKTLTQEFIYGNTNSNPAITTSTSVKIAANTTTLGGVLSAVDATFSGMDFSDWDSYEEDGKYYYYPASLTSLGADFYKK